MIHFIQLDYVSVGPVNIPDFIDIRKVRKIHILNKKNDQSCKRIFRKTKND